MGVVSVSILMSYSFLYCVDSRCLRPNDEILFCGEQDILVTAHANVPDCQAVPLTGSHPYNLPPVVSLVLQQINIAYLFKHLRGVCTANVLLSGVAVANSYCVYDFYVVFENPQCGGTVGKLIRRYLSIQSPSNQRSCTIVYDDIPFEKHKRGHH